MISIKDMYALLELMQDGNFHSAAEKLLMTQSGLSRRISSLESRLKIRLFDRTTRTVRPTAAAEMLAVHWQQALAHYQSGIKAVAAVDMDLSGTMLLGVSATSEYGVWRGIIERFTRRFPKMTFRIEAMSSAEVVSYVLRGVMDAGFCAGPVQEPSLEAKLVETLPYRAIVPQHHPLGRGQELHLRDLIDSKLALSSWQRVRHKLNPALAEAGLSKNIALETDFLDVLLRAVIEQEFIAIQPLPVRYLLPQGVRLVAISDLNLQLDNYFIWKKSTTSPIVRALVGVYHEQYA